MSQPGVLPNGQVQQQLQVGAGQPGQAGGQQSLASGFDVSKLPGYGFQMQQGTQAIENSAAARGGALSGNTAQGLQQYGQGLASTQFQNYMSQLAGLANMGQAAASGTANLGAGLLSGAGASQASGINAAAMANSAGQIGMGNSLSSAFNSPQFQNMFSGGGNNQFSQYNYNPFTQTPDQGYGPQ
jgi:hypothetical protein